MSNNEEPLWQKNWLTLHKANLKGIEERSEARKQDTVIVIINAKYRRLNRRKQKKAINTLPTRTLIATRPVRWSDLVNQAPTSGVSTVHFS